MPNIIQLDDNLVAKIAAGEVIERPSFVVKELIENAIDAGADVVSVTIEESGLKKIIVSDNGSGMSQEDVSLAILPHTTSKLHSELDLHQIKTLGFRGEALASIAAIAELIIQTRMPQDPGGTKVTVNNGEKTVEPIGTPPGTIVTVNNLFANVPARKKFLKTSQTEFRHILESFIRFALAYPSIHFSLSHNKKMFLDLSTKTDTLDRIKSLLGDSFFMHAIPITYEENHIKIFGYIGKPQIAAKHNQKQFIFINNRFVTDKVITLAVREAYGTLLPSSNSPVFVLFLELPYELVDVNVHPQKEQVHFANAKTLFDTVKQAISETLHSNNISFHQGKFKEETLLKSETKTQSASFLKQSLLHPELIHAENILPNSPYIQSNDTYIITFTKDGVLIFDQHAVSERINYESLFITFTTHKNENESFQLPKPFPLYVSPPDSLVITEYEILFEEVGFTFDNFQGDMYMIRSIPSIFKGRNIEKIIRDMISDLSEETGLKTIDVRTQRLIAFLACRSAVKAGDILSESYMKTLITKLQETRNNETCPHGRPTQILYPFQFFDKAFKRK